MAMMSGSIGLSAVRDLLLPGVHFAAGDCAGKDVLAADLSIDYMADAIDLHVKHRLFTRKEIDDQSYKRSPQTGVVVHSTDRKGFAR